MVCPNCFSPGLVRDAQKDSPAGPLSLVVVRLACHDCGREFFQANPELRSSSDGVQRSDPSREAA